MTADGLSRIEDYYGTHATVTKADVYNRGQAENWKYDPRMERVAELRDTDSAGYAQVPAELKLSLAYYAEAKAAAAAAGMDTTAPAELFYPYT